MSLVSRKLELRAIKTMCGNTATSRAMIGKVTEEMFHTETGRIAYSRIMASLREDANPPTYANLIVDPVIPEKHRRILEKENNKPFVNETETKKAVKTLGKYAAARKLLMMAQGILDAVSSDTLDVDALIAKAADDIAGVRVGKTDAKIWKFGKGNNSSDLVKSILEGEGVETIPTTFETWDKVNGGLPKTAVWIIAATTGGGKSVMASTLACNLAEAGYRPGVLPLEMSASEMTARMMARVSKISIEKIVQGKKKLTTNEIKVIDRNFKKWLLKCKENGGTYILPEVETSPTMTEALYMMKALDPSIIIIDYVALLDGVTGDDDWRKLAEAVAEAKQFARAHSIPVVIVAQLGEGALRYSKRMMDHADLMWQWQGDSEAKETGIIHISQPKARNLNPFPFSLKVEWAYTNIRDLKDGEEESVAAEGEKKEKKTKVKMRDMASDLKEL